MDKQAWFNIIDIRTSVKSAKSEMYGDWFRDPWGWPELDFLLEDPSLVVDRLATGEAHFERIDVPKVNFGTRPAVVQEPTDRLALHALVGHLSERLTRELKPFVMGWRLDRDNPKPGVYASNQQEWLGFIHERRRACNECDSVMASDITNFFASISIDRLMEIVYNRTSRSKPSETLEQILLRFNDIPNRNGIPQRSVASSLLANIFLETIDRLLNRYVSMNSDAIAIRWMDDLWVFGGGYEHLLSLQLDIQDELRNLGLEINLGKTAIREGSEVADLVSDEDLEQDPPVQVFEMSGAPYVSNYEATDLQHQLEKFLDRPEMTSRTAIRYICTRLVAEHSEDVLQQVADVASKAPQGADHLARLFARTAFWQNLGEWWVDLAKSPIGFRRMPWSIAQLGTMFPSDPVVDIVSDALCEELDSGRVSPELLALAAHRLPKWNGDDASVLLHRIAENSESPLSRRLVAIALHNMREPFRRIENILREFPENRSTLQMLESRRGRKLPEAPDFDIASMP